MFASRIHLTYAHILPQTPTPPPPAPKDSRWSRFQRTVGRVTLVTIVVSGGTFYYFTQKDRSPGVQLPYDPSKKNIVVVGSGWGATSFLKNIDNTEYNVVRVLSLRVANNISDIYLSQIVVSPRNFFLFTPLLPSVAAGTLSSQSILQRQ